MKKRNGLIGLLKFTFVSFIVFYHYGKMTIGEIDGDAWYLFRGSAIFVEFFFIVSGFYLAAGALKKNPKNLGEDTWKFIFKKFCKLFPYILIGFILSFAVLAVFEHYTFLQMADSIWELLGLKLSGIPTTNVNGPAWYISAMLISMLALYPILCKYKEKYIYLVAPLIVILGLGYLSRMPESLGTWEYFNGLFLKGLVRAFIELNLGCITYLIVQKMKKLNFTNLGRHSLSAIFVLLFSLIVVITVFIPRTLYYNMFLTLLITVSTTIALSEIASINKLFEKDIYSFLEKVSLPLFLTHNGVRYFINYTHMFAGMNYYLILIICYVIAVVVALLVYYLVNFIAKRELVSKIKNKLVTA